MFWTNMYRVVIFLFIIFSPSLVIANEGENLRIFSQFLVGKTLTTDQKSQLHFVKDTLEKRVYSLPSDLVEYQHLVHTDLNDKIIFLQLVVPDNQQNNYRSKLRSLGEPENIVQYTDVIDLLEFPSMGSSFFTDKSHTYIQLVHYYQPTTLDRHRELYGRGYEEIPIQLPKPSIIPSVQQEVKNQSIPYTMIGMWVGVGVMVVLVLGLVWRRKSF